MIDLKQLEDTCMRCDLIPSEVVLKLIAKIEKYEHALNKIAMLGMGEMAYTSDFTEAVNMLARKALNEQTN